MCGYFLGLSLKTILIWSMSTSGQSSNLSNIPYMYIPETPVRIMYLKGNLYSMVIIYFGAKSYTNIYILVNTKLYNIITFYLR